MVNIYHRNHPNVGKYTSRMDPMGYTLKQKTLESNKTLHMFNTVDGQNSLAFGFFTHTSQ